MKYSACIEWLFAAESPDFAGRIRLAREAGLDAVEFWRWSNKDVPAIESALKETGLPLCGMVAEPMIALTDPANHEAFLAGLAESMAVAQRLGAKVLIAQAGNDLSGRSRAEQHEAIVACLNKAARLLAGSNVVLALEPLNTRIDHKGYFLASTGEGLDIVDAVGRPEVRLLYDIYHSMVMGENPPDVLHGRVDRIAHVHVADHPGRNEPGSGQLALAQNLGWLVEQGYAGMFGLEYKPTGPTQATFERARKTMEASA